VEKMGNQNPAYQVIRGGAEAGKRLRQLQDGMVWIVAHREELRKKYPNEYIAVDKNKVVAHTREIVDLKKKLKSKFENFEHVAVDFIGEEEPELILTSMR
jgi:hypothetical protein